MAVFGDATSHKRTSPSPPQVPSHHDSANYSTAISTRPLFRHFGRFFLALFLLFGVAACSSDEDDAARSVLDLAGTAETASSVGQCLDVGPDVGAQVTELAFIECTAPHTHEIYAVVDSESTTYPGFEELEREAQLSCLIKFEEYVGVSAFDSELFYSWLVPSLGSWQDEEDREIVCVAGARGGGDLVASIAKVPDN